MVEISYQHRVEEWFRACFSKQIPATQEERAHRFLEESLELAQASGCKKEEAIELVEYVFSRPTGKADMEVGGVLVTLATLCIVSGVNMNEAGDEELDRNWNRIEEIRVKRESKPLGSPLPQR